MKNGTNGLRFAALVRVSTEGQAKKGESLRTQKRDIDDVVREMGGQIIRWYGGQEHATPGFEKKEVDRLLLDAQSKTRPFDAVIVAHADRWSRDNQKSRQGLDILRESEIRFFVCETEHDLFDPDDSFYLGISAVVGEYHAANQLRKSFRSRIHRAQRIGAPTSGKLPYGRIFDAVTNKWSLDPEKSREIREIANRYISGEKMAALAREFDFNTTHLHKILSHRSGPVWMQRFRSPRLRIDECVETKIPHLLDDATIRAIRARAESNRTVSHGKLGMTEYLLSHMVLCEHCGYAMYGHITPGGRRVYRHSSEDHKHPCPAPHGRGWIDAGELEEEVVRMLFELFGNPSAVKRAIEAATPNLERIKEAQKRIERLDVEFEKLSQGRDRILRLVRAGTVTETQATKELTNIRNDEAANLAERQRLGDSVSYLPSSDEVKAIARRVVDSFGRRFTNARHVARIDVANTDISKMTAMERRELLEMVFGGKLPDGRRMGVYAEWLPGNRPRRVKWRPILRGHLLDQEGQYGRPNSSPKLTDSELEERGGAFLQKDLVNASRSPWC